MVRIAICGGSGYTGGELLRILSGHPKAKITVVTSEKSAGKTVPDLFPHLHRYSSFTYEPLKREKILSKADIFFTALPHGASQEAVDFFVQNGKRVIDLSADFRLRDRKVYEEWYKVPHNFQQTLRKAVYGLPELYRKDIAKAALVANPGCYPTSAILGLYPVLKKGIIRPDGLVIDSKSGTTGAGRKSEVAYSYCEVNEGFKAYGIGNHRHTPEIEQELSGCAGRNITINFTPHLLPLDRGILTTAYGRLSEAVDSSVVHRIYRDAYRKEPFVRVLDSGKFPNVKDVRGSNFCEIGIAVNRRTMTLIVVTAIDNLVKGASGQAVQNMNIMLGLNEKTGLDAAALFP